MIEKRGRGRPRREGADEEILSATRELLDQFGYAALTVDLVSDRTGIAKTTIYRRWPTRGALLAAAIDDPTKTSVEEIETLLSVLDPIDTDAVEIIRTILASRRAHLSDAAIGKLLVRIIVDDRPTDR